MTSISGKFERFPMLSATFNALRSRGEGALVVFVTAGDPDLESFPKLLEALAEGGADVIEVGLPFSDPIADGPVIQASSQRALDRGVTPGAVLEALARCKVEVPIVLMGYYNPILRRGLKEFAQAAKEAGVAGTIVSDLTPEESDAWIEASRAAGLDTVFLAAPTSTDERIAAVAQRSSGFVYAVSRTGVTGSHQAAPPDVGALVARIRAHTEVPVCIGFGISRPEHVAEMVKVADGAVVGSWLVNWLSEHWQAGAGYDALVQAVRELKEATKPQ
jgi:tryptophan synthase alpha chain